MIAIPEFAELTMQEQAQYLWDNGNHLLTRTQEHFTFSLYAVDDFFVEVCYDEQESNVVEIITLENFVRLDAYLKVVSLRGLFV